MYQILKAIWGNTTKSEIIYLLPIAVHIFLSGDTAVLRTHLKVNMPVSGEDSRTRPRLNSKHQSKQSSQKMGKDALSGSVEIVQVRVSRLISCLG